MLEAQAIQGDDFLFHVPVEIVKSGEGSGKERMLLGGIASTADKDREGENLIPEGFDYNFLLKSGYINWHHQAAKNPEAIIGEPINAKVIKGKGLYIEGELYKSSEMAQKAYKLAKTLHSDSKRRKLGWSIEGKVLERDPNNDARVTKARITGVALTHMPINPKTFVDLVKAMGDNAEDVTAKEAVQGKANGGHTVTVGKSSVNVQKGDEEEIVITIKAMTTTSARAVIPESVEGGTKPKSGYPPMPQGTKKIEIEKGMSVEEACEYMFSMYPDMTIKKAKAVIAKIQSDK